MRHWRLVGAGVLVAALVAGPLLFRSAARGPAPSGPPAPTGTRPGSFAYCPEITLRALPPGFAQSDSQLQALPGNVMGHVETYSNGERRIKTFSGVDALDAVEDVELTTREVTAGGKPFQLHSTVVFPGLLLAELEVAQPDQHCDGVFVQGTGVPLAQFMTVLGGLELPTAR